MTASTQEHAADPWSIWYSHSCFYTRCTKTHKALLRHVYHHKTKRGVNRDWPRLWLSLKYHKKIWLAPGFLMWCGVTLHLLYPVVLDEHINVRFNTVSQVLATVWPYGWQCLLAPLYCRPQWYVQLWAVVLFRRWTLIILWIFWNSLSICLINKQKFGTDVIGCHFL